MKIFKVLFLIPALFLSMLVAGQNNAPVAVNDTIIGVVGNTITITSGMLLGNDYDPDGDPIFISSISSALKVNDTTWTLSVWPYICPPFSAFSYTVKDNSGTIAFPKAFLVVRNIGYSRYDSVNKNNINALINTSGNNFWDYENAHFEVPKGSGKHSLFNSTLWIGGLSPSNQLSLAAERYKQTGSDFFAGPKTAQFDSLFYVKWNRVWKVDKEQIINHISNWNNSGYTPPEVITNWPAHGDPALGQTLQIAPFYDNNSNGKYEPMQGDYPLIRGDQCVLFIINDCNGIHCDSKGSQLGIQIVAMAYEYDLPDDSTLNNTLFMHYDITNLSDTTYTSTSVGIFADFDLGFPKDDYIGCDVKNGMMYVYNASTTDGNGEPNSYGANPPTLGCKIIGGPLMEADGIDNEAGGCDESINGMNFGDQIADNERLGMTGYFCFNNGWPGYYGTDPGVAIDYYHYLNSKWKDGTHLIFGGDGHITIGGAETECRYIFPDNSDTLCNWGTNGVLPQGGFNLNGYYWNERTSGNAPGDRHGLASIGPFTFKAGQTIPLDYCFTWAQANQGGPLASLDLLRERIANQSVSWNQLTNIPQKIMIIPEEETGTLIKVFPNPAHHLATVQFHGKQKAAYQLLTIGGAMAKQGYFTDGSNTLDLSQLKPGIYFLRCEGQSMKIIHL